ncbi:MAG: hypothetical protein MI740_14970 [Halanaerobiales bacterium]|nr:hypothetical protein [Halanaerobiales bacterium]
MFKWLSRLSLTLLGLIGLAGIAFIAFVSLSLASPQVEPPPVKPVIVSDYDLQLELARDRDQRIETRKTALEKQIDSLKNQEKILENQQRVIENKINQGLATIKEGYQQRVDNYQKAIQSEYQIYNQYKEQEFKEKVLLKKDLSEKRLEAMGEQLRQEQLKKLSVYTEEQMAQLYQETLSYRLNLTVLELTEAEKELNQSKIKGIEQQYQGALEKRRVEIEAEGKAKLAELEEQFNQEFLQYQQNLTEEINQDLKRRQLIDQQKVEEYLGEQQELLEQELRARRKELGQRSELELTRLKGLIADIRTGYYLLEAELVILEKEGIK